MAPGERTRHVGPGPAAGDPGFRAPTTALAAGFLGALLAGLLA